MTTPLMTWNRRSKTWFKKYHGKQYAVSCKGLSKQLPTLYLAPTEEGSRRAANHWWQVKRINLDHEAALVPLEDQLLAIGEFGDKAGDHLNKLQALIKRYANKELTVAESLQSLNALLHNEPLPTFTPVVPVASGPTIEVVKTEFLSVMHARVGQDLSPGRYDNIGRALRGLYPLSVGICLSVVSTLVASLPTITSFGANPKQDNEIWVRCKSVGGGQAIHSVGISSRAYPIRTP